jgi:hypothetical protein
MVALPTWSQRCQIVVWRYVRLWGYCLEFLALKKITYQQDASYMTLTTPYSTINILCEHWRSADIFGTKDFEVLGKGEHRSRRSE